MLADTTPTAKVLPVCTIVLSPAAYTPPIASQLAIFDEAPLINLYRILLSLSYARSPGETFGRSVTLLIDPANTLPTNIPPGVVSSPTYSFFVSIVYPNSP